jgi:DNA invertase Pin-like site-specific DNA recombinase
MNSEKITILYSRLSRDDELQGQSASIENQEPFLEDYAKKNGFIPYIKISDDGWSGTNWNRPGWQEIINRIEQGEVSAIISKDTSRIGRDYLRMGLYRETFRDKGVRLICVNDGVDTARGEDDFTPFREIINEYYARDTSRKIRAINDTRTKNGKHVTGSVPYGYLRDKNQKSVWVLDAEAAPIVERIFRSVIDGKGVTQIADELTADNILIPTAHWTKVGAGMRSCPNADPTRWSAATVIQILKKEEYMGWSVLNKTVKETYKSKRKPNAPENKLIFKDSHPAIITEEMFRIVQRLRETKRVPKTHNDDSNPLTGILYCADCGHKLFHKQGKSDSGHKPHDEYCCSSYRHYTRSCTMHYIRTSIVESLILNAIKSVANYAKLNEEEFLEKVRQCSNIQAESAVKESKAQLAKMTRRRDEVFRLIKKLYENYALEKITETNFAELLSDYNTEQKNLDTEINRIQAEIEGNDNSSVNPDKFLALVNRFTNFDTYSATLLNEFIERVIVHESDKSSGERIQKVEIIFNFIGKFDIPQEPITITAETSTESKPKRTDKDREYDRRRYAKKRNAKLAAEAETRLQILAGTSFAA